MKKYLLLITLLFLGNTYSQNSFQNSFDGVWKLKVLENDETSLEFTDHIKFINNEIHFYKVESETEKLLFMEKVEFENNTMKSFKLI